MAEMGVQLCHGEEVIPELDVGPEVSVVLVNRYSTSGTSSEVE